MKNYNYSLLALAVMSALPSGSTLAETNAPTITTHVTANATQFDAGQFNEKLFLAARSGRYESVYDLIGQGANVNYGNLSRETPMHAAASQGHLDVMRLLQANGARHDRQTSGKWMPLHHAVRFGHIQVAQYLLQLGTPLYVRTKDGKTVFDIAQGTKDERMLRFLNGWRQQAAK